MKLDKNNSATWMGLIIAIVVALETIDFTNFNWKSDWWKAAIPCLIAIKSYYVSFNEKSLNSKAKNGIKGN